MDSQQDDPKDCMWHNTCTSEPMLWIGIYIAIASFFCVLAMAADLLHGFRSKKYWFPCKYFSLNAASITVITVAMKLPLDLTSDMPSNVDQAAKVGSLGFMCTIMANLMPSLASMDNKTLLENTIGLCILVITVIVNTCIELNTGVITNEHFVTWVGYIPFRIQFGTVAYIYTTMVLLSLILMISSSLTIPTCKETLELKYQATNKVSLTNQTPKVEKLRQYVRRYWVMAQSGSPQFGMASNPLSTASGVICVIVLVMNLLVVFKALHFEIQGKSSYKWSTTFIFITQSTGVMVGTIAPISRCFSVFSFKLDAKWNRKFFMFFKVEGYWIQKLHEWKQCPLFFQCPGSKSLIYNSKNIILSICIVFQTVIVISCKVIWLIATTIPIFVVSCFTTPDTSRTVDIDEDLSSYVIQIDNEIELAEKTLKDISKSMDSFLSKEG